MLVEYFQRKQYTYSFPDVHDTPQYRAMLGMYTYSTGTWISNYIHGLYEI